MLFVLQDEFCIWNVWEDHSAIGRWIGGDGLVAEIERDAVAGGTANHTSEKQCRRLEVKIRKHLSVPDIVEHAGARIQFNRRIVDCGINRELPRAARNDARHRPTVGRQLVS